MEYWLVSQELLMQILGQKVKGQGHKVANQNSKIISDD